MRFENLMALNEALDCARKEQPTPLLLISTRSRKWKEETKQTVEGVDDVTATFVVVLEDGTASTQDVHLTGEAAESLLIPMSNYVLDEVQGWLYASGSSVRCSWSASKLEAM